MTDPVAAARAEMIPELIADYIWTHTPKESKRAFKIVGQMQRAPARVRRAIAKLAGMSRQPSAEEWEGATHVIARRVRQRRALTGGGS